MVGAGASSSTFWWRRWVEQSRSHRCSTVPWRVGHDLHLDVPAVLDVPLDQDGVVAERRRASRFAAATASSSSSGRAHDPHALAATSGGGLHQDGERAGVLAPRHHGHAGGDRDLAGVRPCGAIASIASAGGPIHARPAADHGASERGVLREEAVAGVHGLADVRARPRRRRPRRVDGGRGRGVEVVRTPVEPSRRRSHPRAIAPVAMDLANIAVPVDTAASP